MRGVSTPARLQQDRCRLIVEAGQALVAGLVIKHGHSSQLRDAVRSQIDGLKRTKVNTRDTSTRLDGRCFLSTYPPYFEQCEVGAPLPCKLLIDFCPLCFSFLIPILITSLGRQAILTGIFLESMMDSRGRNY
jgi:hypothetical protein